jgi:hypothetical protein
MNAGFWLRVGMVVTLGSIGCGANDGSWTQYDTSSLTDGAIDADDTEDGTDEEMQDSCAPGTTEPCLPRYPHGCTGSQTCSDNSTWGSCVDECASFMPNVYMPGVYLHAFSSYKTGPNCSGSQSTFGPWQVCPFGSHIVSHSCKMTEGTGSCSTFQESPTWAGLTVDSVDDCEMDAWAKLVVECLAD